MRSIDIAPPPHYDPVSDLGNFVKRGSGNGCGIDGVFGLQDSPSVILKSVKKLNSIWFKFKWYPPPPHVMPWFNVTRLGSDSDRVHGVVLSEVIEGNSSGLSSCLLVLPVTLIETEWWLAERNKPHTWESWRQQGSCLWACQRHRGPKR